MVQLIGSALVVNNSVSQDSVKPKAFSGASVDRKARLSSRELQFLAKEKLVACYKSIRHYLGGGCRVSEWQLFFVIFLYRRR